MWDKALECIYGIFRRISYIGPFRAALTVILLMTVLVVDTSIFRISDLIRINMSTVWTTPLFVIISVLFLILQYFTLGFVRSKNITKVGKPRFGLDSLTKFVLPVQVILSTIIVFVIFQIIVLNYIDTRAVSFNAVLSYALAIFLLAVLTQKFFYWYRLKRNRVVLLYALSSALLAIKSLFSLALITVMSSGIPLYVGSSQLGGMTLPLSANPWAIALNEAITISSVLSFVLFWIATATLLTSYAKKLGKITYWFLLSIPLVYFLSQFPALVFKVFEGLMISNPSLYGIILTLLFGSSATAGGILFGIAFWTISRHLAPDNPVKYYTLIAAFGISLFFISDQGGSVLYRIGGLYPPYGLPTVSAMALASYLMLIGIYSSAISVAQDSGIRKLIRKSVREELRLLDRIGTAQMQKEIESKVIYFAKRETTDLIEDSGIEPSLSDSDVQGYLKQVLDEVKRERGQK
jgi:hypothetical protein